MEDESFPAQKAFRVPRQLPVQTPQDAAGGAGGPASFLEGVKPGQHAISRRGLFRKIHASGFSAVLNRSEML
jgi:hypothetical protein